MRVDHVYRPVDFFPEKNGGHLGPPPKKEMAEGKNKGHHWSEFLCPKGGIVSEDNGGSLREPNNSLLTCVAVNCKTKTQGTQKKQDAAARLSGAHKQAMVFMFNAGIAHEHG